MPDPSAVSHDMRLALGLMAQEGAATLHRIDPAGLDATICCTGSETVCFPRRTVLALMRHQLVETRPAGRGDCRDWLMFPTDAGRRFAYSTAMLDHHHRQVDDWQKPRRSKKARA